jgi:hypothetical protein
MKAHSLFGRFCTVCSCRQLDDPVFGHMRRRKGCCWEADTTLADTDHLLVDVFAPDSGPSEAQREMFAHLKDHFCELKASMEGPLYDKYVRIREMFHAQYVGKPFEPEFTCDFPCVQCAAGIWSIAHLCRVDLYGQRERDVVLDHRMGWENDHHLDVTLKDWQVVDIAMDACDG